MGARMWARERREGDGGGRGDEMFEDGGRGCLESGSDGRVGRTVYTKMRESK